MTARYLGMNHSDGLTVTDLEHISQSIGDILRTPVGSRVMRRDYGSLLASMIDQPQTPALELQIKVACYMADDSALKGKWALFAKITPTDDLIAMNKAAQKVYTSMEIQPNFANTGKCYLVGLAVTDDPASLGTEYLEFCRTAKHNPLNRFKLSPENLISVATPVELEFEDLPETVFTALTEKVKSIFGRKQASDDARLNDVHEAVTAVAEHVQEKLSATEQRLAEMETAFSALKQAVTDRADETSQAFTRLKNSLDHTESLTQQRRSKATGGGGDGLMTNC
ncbi:baseplate assembly protein W [Escherichia coli]|nr:baseplate assembly protein W [Escherichia coli]